MKEDPDSMISRPDQMKDGMVEDSNVAHTDDFKMLSEEVDSRPGTLSATAWQDQLKYIKDTEIHTTYSQSRPIEMKVDMGKQMAAPRSPPHVSPPSKFVLDVVTTPTVIYKYILVFGQSNDSLTK